MGHIVNCLNEDEKTKKANSIPFNDTEEEQQNLKQAFDKGRKILGADVSVITESIVVCLRLDLVYCICDR